MPFLSWSKSILGALSRSASPQSLSSHLSTSWCPHHSHHQCHYHHSPFTKSLIINIASIITATIITSLYCTWSIFRCVPASLHCQSNRENIVSFTNPQICHTPNQTQEKTLHRLEDRTLYSLSESNNASGEIKIVNSSFFTCLLSKLVQKCLLSILRTLRPSHRQPTP